MQISIDFKDFIRRPKETASIANLQMDAGRLPLRSFNFRADQLKFPIFGGNLTRKSFQD
jgi:hypothetical protein